MAVGWLLAACSPAGNKNMPEDTTMVIGNAAGAVPADIPYNIVHEYPHDPAAFTEGLEYNDGFLYESTGQYGHSDLRKTELTTGKVLASHKLDQRYFGEGITILNGKIYQLTYREGKCFVYDLKTLQLEKTFNVKSDEGWGMTNDGNHLIYDDGTSTIRFMDPATFTEVKRLKVTDEHGPVKMINEPELIHGSIYANQWKTDYILKIDTATGRVTGRADLGTLRERGGIKAFDNKRGNPESLNGIAYDVKGNRIFITGKNWPKVFEITLDN